MTGRFFRSALVLLLAFVLVPGVPTFAQDQTQGQTQAQTPSASQTPTQGSAPSPAVDPQRDMRLHVGHEFSYGKSAFPNIIQPYTAMTVDHPGLTNSPRIDQLVHDGKLMLSLDDAISLALENNLDIAVQRYVVWAGEIDILRTKGGGRALGLPGIGAAGGLGNVPQLLFDPTLSATYSWSRSHFPVNNPITSGTGTNVGLATLTDYNQIANVQYSQGFHTGTSMIASLDNTRSSSTSTFQFFNPAVQSTLNFQIQQQLLNGFGIIPNTRFILEAKNDRKIADAVFSLQVITTIQQVTTDYWELVFARENVGVQQAALSTSTKLYGDNKKQVEIGTLAPLEIIRAESEVATDRQNLIIAQTNQMQQQTVLLNAITKNPMANGLQDVEVVPSDAVTKLPSVDVIPLADAVNVAWKQRPEVRQAELNLKNDDIEVKTTKNGLLPQLTIFGQYQGTGLAGVNQVTPGPPPVFVSTGLPDSLSTAFGTDFPTYAAGITLNLPIRNRIAQADAARAQIDQRQDETRLQSVKNSIIVDVRNAQIALQQDQAQVEAAGKARELAQETLDAEQKKYQLGASTTFLVIQAQRDLTTAKGNEIRALANLQEARVAYDKALGHLLDVNRITIADAQRGRAIQPPLIPGTPSLELIGTPAGK